MNKTVYTKLFLKQLNLAISKENIAQYFPTWWKNTREKEAGGLRLTEEGFDMLSQIDLATYKILYPPDMPITTQVIIFLDQFIDCPYYLDNTAIHVTNEKKAVELTLFSGDLRKYGITKAMKRSENLPSKG